MVDYKEMVSRMTDTEIFALLNHYRVTRNGEASNKLRRAYILHQATETEGKDYFSHLWQSVMILEQLFIKVSSNLNQAGEEPIESHPDKISGINGFLEARKYLNEDNPKAFGEANSFREMEASVFGANEKQRLNSEILFNAYIDNKTYIIAGKSIEEQAGENLPLLLVLDSLSNGTYETFKEIINATYESFKAIINARQEEWDRSAEPPTSESLRTNLLGVFSFYYASEKVTGNLTGAKAYLEKALEVVQPDEIEYNILRFLQKELRLTVNAD